ncbi:MAG TPA: TIGR03087 family PEP-CTERM/XrtA system glycosyltransferase [Chromatiales bacterium]|nr:TIGR03087 family PEP-CTERM/XrtA system glycosyltransferase [Chromatiales bacterium]
MRPKILFVCHRFPFPPKRGGKIRPFNIIRHLQQRADVTVASVVRSEEEEAEATGIREHCSRFLVARVSPLAANLRMIAKLPGPEPSSMGYFYSPELARRINETVAREHFQLVFVHCSSAAQYVENLTAVPKVMDFGDMDSEKWFTYAAHRPFPASAGYWLEATKLRRAEVRLARQFDLSTCTTRAELDTLKSLQAAVHTDWFPNGVDNEFFSPSSDPYDHDMICFTGRMDYFPNQQAADWLARDIFPRVHRLRPSARLMLVGAAPPRRVQRLGELPGVTVTGTVEDVRPYVLQSAVSVAPLRIARGTQNKILEASAMGVPVITTPVAAQGVDMRPGQDLLVADNAEEFAVRILELMEQPDRRMEFSVAARRRMLSHHSWQASMERLDDILGHRFPDLFGHTLQRQEQRVG